MKCGKWEDVNSFRLHPLIYLNLKWKNKNKKTWKIILLWKSRPEVVF